MSDAEWDCDEGEPDAHRFTTDRESDTVDVKDITARLWQHFPVGKRDIEQLLAEVERLRAELAEREALRSALVAMVEKWRKGAHGVEAEIASGLRAKHPEGPRYGIAAVRACADDLDALIAETLASLGARS